MGKIVAAIPVAGVVPGDPSMGPARAPLTAKQQREYERLRRSPHATTELLNRLDRDLQSKPVDTVIQQIKAEEAKLIKTQFQTEAQRKAWRDSQSQNRTAAPKPTPAAMPKPRG